MKKMFHGNYNGELSDMPPTDMVPELVACRACLATDTKLYLLGGVVKDNYEYLMGTQLTTSLVRTVDRVSHKLLLKFTLGIDTKVIHVLHDDENDKEKCTQNEAGKSMDMDTDGLNDVLNDFEEITNTLRDDIELGNNEFDDFNGSLLIDRANFSVDELFKGKAITDLNEISGKSINNDIGAGDIVYRAFKGKGKSAAKKTIDNESNADIVFKGKGKSAVKKSFDNDSNDSRAFKGKGKFADKKSTDNESNADRNGKGKGVINDIGDIIYRAFKGKDNSPVKKYIDNETKAAGDIKGKGKPTVKKYIVNDSNSATAFESKSINDDIGDIIYRAFKGKDKSPVKKSIDNGINPARDFEGKGTSAVKESGNKFNDARAFKGKGKFPVEKSIDNESHTTSAFKGKSFKKSIDNESHAVSKKALNEDTNSTIPDAEEILNANLNDNFTPDITLNDVSINTNDLNNTDSNLVEAFNSFILDHDYLDEKFLLESGDPEFMKKNAISKKTDEDSLLREILPKMTKKDKKLLLKELETTAKETRKPVKDLSKLKEMNKRDKIKAKNDKIDFTMNEQNDINNEDSKPKPIVVKPELPIDDQIKTESKEFIKFGSDFRFRVFELSKDEQLEELQKKREGLLYVSALYKCVDCAKGFRSAVTYSNHIKVHDRNYGPFECAICHTRHKSEARRRRHQDTHRLKYCCTQCEFVARSREKAESHFEWHSGRTFACRYCGDEFRQVSTHLSHVRLHHPAQCVWCALCGEAFVGAHGLRMHTRRRHPAVSAPQESQCVCNTCRARFRQPDALRRHQAVGCHPACKPCAECGDGFDSHEARALHTRLSHAHALQCYACDATFASGRSLQTHVERAHWNVRPRAAAPPRAPAKRTMCDLCGNKYHSAAALVYHQRSHSGERPYACARCPRAFALPHSLQAHLRTHTGEKPYQCTQCPRAFRNANNLARHKKNIHLGQKQYSRCSLCLKWFSSAGAARLHVATIHGQPLPRKR